MLIFHIFQLATPQTFEWSYGLLQTFFLIFFCDSCIRNPHLPDSTDHMLRTGAELGWEGSTPWLFPKVDAIEDELKKNNFKRLLQFAGYQNINAGVSVPCVFEREKW